MLFYILLHSAAGAIYFLRNPRNFFSMMPSLLEYYKWMLFVQLNTLDRHTETISKKVRVGTHSSCSSICNVNTVILSANTYTGQGHISCTSRCSISMSLQYKVKRTFPMLNYFEKWPPKPWIGIVMKVPGPYLSCKIKVKSTCFELQKKKGKFKIKNLLT